ncbi:MAG: hypothetical protein KC583_20250, partial [Myxococcales bacterium]|nr:hypothetical protein [Myxococcales bacterium]
MSERQYVTELRVNAPTDQVVKLNDALRNVQNTIQAIRSAGPVTPTVGAGAGAMGGAVAPMGGGGGFAGGGPGRGMPTAWGGAGGGGGWAAGGGFAGGGGAPGGGGGFAGRVGRIGNALPTTGQGAVVGAATAIGGLVGMGAFTGAIAADYLRSVDKAVQTDRARSRLRGLTGGAVRWVGGSAYGYTPAEAAEIATQAAQTGVAGAGNVLNLSTLALQMERMG